MTKTLTGECLCVEVKFSVEDSFKAFYQCHCKQCQQLTGTAFASNLFTEPTNLTWLQGEHRVTVFEHQERGFSKSFCENCGSALPFVNKTKTSLVVPAGALNEMPSIELDANIFTKEQACWLEQSSTADRFSGFPK